MANPYFKFKLFTVRQDHCAMKVTTDACLFGSWVAENILLASNMKQNVLDIGTGTGLLSLMIAQKNPSLHIDALEIDEAAFEQAKENFNSSPWGKNISAKKGDLNKLIPHHQYDIMLSNPPFYENELRSPDQQINIAHHSEVLPLGTLIDFITSNLHPSGHFYLLLPYKRNEEIKKMLMKKFLAIEQLVFVRPLTGKEYSRIMVQGKPAEGVIMETKISDITIFSSEQKYSKEFVALMKDYYLYL